MAEPKLQETGDVLDMRTIFERYYRDIWRLLRRLGVADADLDDAAQEVFWVAARRLSDIRPDRVHPFLYGVALRVASNARRKLATAKPHVIDPGLVSEAPLADEQMENAQARRLLQTALSRMSPPLRSVFVLYELERLEVREIAEIEGIPVGTASSRLRRAREEFSAICKRVRATLKREIVQ